MEIIIALLALGLGLVAGIYIGRQRAATAEALAEALRKDIRHASAEELLARQKELQSANSRQIGSMLQPIKEQFAAFQKAVGETSAQSARGNAELQGSFEKALELFRQQQDMAVRQLREQTERIGSDAANLTRALRAENKTQGDWGEMVLESVLESSGLQRGVEYFTQKSIAAPDGRTYRPDVVVRFPEGRTAVIDSKVSLSAYIDAVAADDETLRAARLKAHVRSMRQHIDELAEKDYSKVVEGNIGFVMMFVPNENSYIAAMRQEPQLGAYAYSRGIIVLSPSNLLMAVQLIYNMWQTDRQNKNTEKIVKTANDLYDKLAAFADTFADVERRIDDAARAFAKAKSQLYDGAGNVMRRMEGLKALGLTPKKQIKGVE